MFVLIKLLNEVPGKGPFTRNDNGSGFFCEVLLVVPRSTGNPLMDLTSVPDNNSWCIVD